MTPIKGTGRVLGQAGNASALLQQGPDVLHVPCEQLSWQINQRMGVELGVSNNLGLGSGTCLGMMFTTGCSPTLAVGLLDFKVHVVLALRPEPDCSAQPPSIPAVPNHQVSLQCLATKNP